MDNIYIETIENSEPNTNNNSNNFSIIDNNLVFKQQNGKKEIFTKVPIDFIKYLQIVSIKRENIEEITGFRIHDISLYQNAFVHKSVSQVVKILSSTNAWKETNYKFPQFMTRSNERFEFLGDSVYNMALCTYIYERFPTQPEGFLSRLNALVKNKSTLSMFSSKLGLDKYILMVKPQQVKETEFKFSNSILEDTFESFIAAIFLDHGGFNGNGCKYVYYFVKKCVETLIDRDPEFDNSYNIKLSELSENSNPENYESNESYKNYKNESSSFLDGIIKPNGLKNFMLRNENYKDILQRHCQSNHGTVPIYTVIEESGFGHSVEFTVNVSINDTVIPNCISKGKTKKEAEQGSARKALSELNVEDSRDVDYFDM